MEKITYFLHTLFSCLLKKCVVQKYSLFLNYYYCKNFLLFVCGIVRMCVCNNSECCSCFDSFSFSPNIIVAIIVVIIVNLTSLCDANSVIIILLMVQNVWYSNFYHAVCIPHQLSLYY
jgi:hypothetical protein